MKYYNQYVAIILIFIVLGCSKSRNNNEQENSQDLQVKEVYHENGKLKQRCTYLRDTLVHGQCETYNEKGVLVNLENFIKGNRYGEQKIFFDDGTLKALLNYDKGVLDGQCLYYFDNGKLEQAGRFDNNEPYGLFKYYDSLGNLQSEINWISGKKEGKSFDYYPSGDIKMYNYFNNDSLIYSRYYEESGESISRLGYPFTTYELQKDILSVGDTLILSIKSIPEPPHCELKIILGNIIDSEKELLDSPTYSDTLEGKLIFKRVYDKKGNYQLGLVILYIDKDSGESIGTSIYKNNNLKVKVS